MTTIRKKVGGSLLALFVVSGLALMLLMPDRSGRESARRAYCEIQLRAIGRAMQSYHATYGSLPPAYIADENGRPIHSCRVLLLPFMDQRALYDEYRFDEPWNGPHNTALHDRLKSNPFYCPSSRQPHHTNYVAVIGSQTAMPGARPRKLDELRNGASSTILIVEALNCGTHWMEPKDLNFDDMCFGINDPCGRGIASAHSGYKGERWKKPVPLAHVLMADGAVREMPETTPPREIHKLLLIENDQHADNP